MSALPDVVGIDERRYQRQREDEERRERSSESLLEHWRIDGEVLTHLWEALAEHPSAEVLVDRIVFGCRDARDAAGGALYGILAHYAQRRVDRNDRVLAEIDEAAELSEPF